MAKVAIRTIRRQETQTTMLSVVRDVEWPRGAMTWYHPQPLGNTLKFKSWVFNGFRNCTQPKSKLKAIDIDNKLHVN